MWITYSSQNEHVHVNLFYERHLKKEDLAFSDIAKSWLKLCLHYNKAKQTKCSDLAVKTFDSLLQEILSRKAHKYATTFNQLKHTTLSFTLI